MFAGIVLVLTVTLFRLLPLLMDVGLQQPAWMPNFSPMAALCLCVAACFPRRWAIVLPFVVLLGTDALLNWHYAAASQSHSTAGQVAAHYPFLSVELLAKTLAFVVIGAFGWELRKQARVKVLLPAAIGSSLFFYLVTNTASWLTEPGYSGTVAGWAQALTTGLPQYPPAWQFYRNTLVSDVLFTLLFLACLRIRPAQLRSESEPAAAW